MANTVVERLINILCFPKKLTVETLLGYHTAAPGNYNSTFTANGKKNCLFDFADFVVFSLNISHKNSKTTPNINTNLHILKYKSIKRTNSQDRRQKFHPCRSPRKRHGLSH